MSNSFIKKRSVSKTPPFDKCAFARRRLLELLIIILIIGQFTANKQIQTYEVVPDGYEWTTINTSQGTITYPVGYNPQTNFTLATQQMIDEETAPIKKRYRSINVLAGFGLLLYFLARRYEKQK